MCAKRKGKRQKKTFYEVISIWEKRNTSFIPILMGNGKKGSKKPERKIHILCKTIKSIDIILLQDGIIVSCWCCFSFCFVIEWNILLLFWLFRLVKGNNWVLSDNIFRSYDLVSVSLKTLYISFIMEHFVPWLGYVTSEPPLSDVSSNIDWIGEMF